MRHTQGNSLALTDTAVAAQQSLLKIIMPLGAKQDAKTAKQ